MLITLTRFHGIWRTNSVCGWILGFPLVWFSKKKKNVTKSVSGIIHDHKVIGAGFNLLVNATNDDDEEGDVEPLEWLNCAANKANMANKEMVMRSASKHTQQIWFGDQNLFHSDWIYVSATNNWLTGCLDLEKLAVTAPSLPGKVGKSYFTWNMCFSILTS